MTQKQRIFDRLMPADRKMPGHWVSMRDLNAICFRYGARLYDLRRDGYEFEEYRNHDGEWFYRVTSFPPCNGESVSCVTPPSSVSDARSNSGVGPKTDPGDLKLTFRGIE
ncbi:MAG: hypothetical protein WC455_12415 [Dehalococcoidia bacterium]|jgi:hypothetical protein